MGGKVLNYRSKEIFREAMEKGLEEGREEGRLEGSNQKRSSW